MADKTSSDFVLRAQEWLHSHDTGLSSEAIFHYMTLGVKDGSTPADPADLARCLRLLERFPEWKPRMSEMATVSADWAELMPHWETIVASFLDEAGGAVPEKYADWRAKRTYDLMHDVFYERVNGMLQRKRHSRRHEVVIEL